MEHWYDIVCTGADTVPVFRYVGVWLIVLSECRAVQLKSARDAARDVVAAD